MYVILEFPIGSLKARNISLVVAYFGFIFALLAFILNPECFVPSPFLLSLFLAVCEHERQSLDFRAQKCNLVLILYNLVLVSFAPLGFLPVLLKVKTNLVVLFLQVGPLFFVSGISVLIFA